MIFSKTLVHKYGSFALSKGTDCKGGIKLDLKSARSG